MMPDATPGRARRRAIRGWMLACLLLGACDCDREQAPARGLRNLILISMDTQRADRLALYGGHVKTPNLRRLASRGALFERAYAHAPMTGPSHASLFTSLLPAEHGVRNNGRRLASKFTTLAEALAATGRTTAAFVSLAAMSHEYGFDQGFDTYEDRETRRYWWMSARELNRHVLPWFAEHHDEPFFAFVHYSDPHAPYAPPAKYQRLVITRKGERVEELEVDGRRLYFRHAHPPGSTDYTLTLEGEVPVRCVHWKYPSRVELTFGDGFEIRPHGDRKVRPDDHILVPGQPATLTVHNRRASSRRASIRFDGLLQQTDAQRRRGYDLETRFLDRQLGRLLAALDRHGLWDDTAIVVTADHGEELGEHRGHFGHVQHLFESVVRVPLIIVAPGWFEPGSRVPRVVRHVDLGPTLARVLGFDLPADVRGRSLWPVSEIGERIAVAQTHRPQARTDRGAAIEQRLKLAVELEKGTEELRDLTRPGPEWKAVVRKPDDGQRAVRAVLERALGVLRPETAEPGAPFELDERAREALRALGYVE
jgi:arylsulfatase A-like enzyme